MHFFPKGSFVTWGLLTRLETLDKMFYKSMRSIPYIRLGHSPYEKVGHRRPWLVTGLSSVSWFTIATQSLKWSELVTAQGFQMVKSVSPYIPNSCQTSWEERRHFGELFSNEKLSRLNKTAASPLRPPWFTSVSWQLWWSGPILNDWMYVSDGRFSW